MAARSPGSRLPSPVAHVGVALAIAWAVRPTQAPRSRVFAAACAASVAPDLDILAALILPGGLAWHHGPTHSLVGAAGLGWLTARALGAADRLPAVLAAMAHVPMDWHTGTPGAPQSYGVPVFWPLVTERSMSAHPWFVPYHIDGPGFLWNMVGPRAFPAYARELLTVGIAFAVSLAVRASLRRIRARAP